MDDRFYHVDEDDDGGDGDRCGGLHDHVVDGDGFLVANSPSRHVPEARVWWFFMSGGCSGSPLRNLKAHD